MPGRLTLASHAREDPLSMPDGFDLGPEDGRIRIEVLRKAESGAMGSNEVGNPTFSVEGRLEILSSHVRHETTMTSFSEC